MKVAGFVFVLTLILLTADCESRLRPRPRRQLGNFKGINLNKGRHNVNLNYRNTNYNYNGRNWNGRANYNYWNRNLGAGANVGKWNLNANHNFGNGGTGLGANRGNHNFNANYNHRNGQVGVGYKWKFGRRRRRDLGTNEGITQTPEIRLSELRQDLDIIKAGFSALLPAINQVSLPPVPEEPITERILAQDILCLVHQFGQLLPQMETFIKKLVTKHSPAYSLEPELSRENIEGCEVRKPSVHDARVSGPISGNDLLELKTFVSSLILTELQLRASLPEKQYEHPGE